MVNMFILPSPNKNGVVLEIILYTLCSIALQIQNPKGSILIMII